MADCPVELGQKVRFCPDAFGTEINAKNNNNQSVSRKVTGTVEYINHRHRYYRAAFEAGETTLHECFKF